MTEDFVNPGTVITTAPFKSSAGDYFSIAFRNILGKWWWTAAFPVILFCSLALLYDLRWLFVALIFIFLVLPFMIANAYFSRLLTPHAQLALAMKKVKIITGNRIEIAFIDDEGEVSGVKIIEWNNIKDIQESTNFWLIILKNSHKSEIIIPKQSIVNKYRLQNHDDTASRSDFFD